MGENRNPGRLSDTRAISDKPERAPCRSYAEKFAEEAPEPVPSKKEALSGYDNSGGDLAGSRGLCDTMRYMRDGK